MLLPKQTNEPKESVTLPNQPSETKVTVEIQDSRPLGLSLSLVPPSPNIPIVRPSKRPPPKPLHQQQLQFIKLGNNSVTATSDVACVVCKRPARANSVYCSDECIRKYAHNSIQAHIVGKEPEPVPQTVAQTPLPNALDVKKNKKKDLFEDVLRQADSMSKVERVCCSKCTD